MTLDRPVTTLRRQLRPLLTREACSWFGAAGLLILVLLVGNYPLISGQAAPIWDAADYYAPSFSLVGDHVKHGALMLWNPWIDAGTPDFAEPQTGGASPILICFAALFSNPFHGFIIYWVSFWSFGGIGMLLLCKHLGCPPWGGVIAALGFATSGFYSGHGEHTAILYSYSMFPWILWRFDAGLSERRFRGIVEAGALWGASALGGYPQLTVMQPFFLVLWAFSMHHSLFFAKGSTRRVFYSRARFAIGAFVVFGLVGAAIMSPTYISFFVEGRGYTARANPLPRDYLLNAGLLPPKALSTFASPILYLMQLPPATMWRGTDVTLVNVYVGALVAVLAIAGLFRRSKQRLCIAGIGAFFLACAVGGHLPIRGWLYDLVPPTRFFRHAGLFRCYAMFVIAILGGLASVDLRRSDDSRYALSRLRFCAVSILLALVAYACFQQIHVPHAPMPQFSFAPVHFGVVWISVVVVLALWQTRILGSHRLPWLLVPISIFDAGSALYLSSPTMYSPASLSWWEAMESKHDGDLDLTRRGLDRKLLAPAELADYYAHNRNVAIKEPELSNQSGLTSRIFEAFVRDTFLRQIALGPNRIWFSSRPAWSPPDQKSFSAFAESSRSLGFPIMVLHSPAAMAASFDAAQASTGTATPASLGDAHPLAHAPITLLKYTPNALSMVYRGTERGWLLITDRWAEGWVATVNGREAPILGADFLFRAVSVEAGDNTIVMSYRPRGYALLMIVSWGTLAIILIWRVWQLARLLHSHVRVG